MCACTAVLVMRYSVCALHSSTSHTVSGSEGKVGNVWTHTSAGPVNRGGLTAKAS